jgi:hypothetical protein
MEPSRETTADWRPIMECPRWDICSAPTCPLDRLWAARDIIADPDDEVCKARRSTREEIAARHPALKNGGLTQAEIANDRRSVLYKARLAAETPEQAEARRLQREANHVAMQAQHRALKVGPPISGPKGNMGGKAASLHPQGATVGVYTDRRPCAGVRAR